MVGQIVVKLNVFLFYLEVSITKGKTIKLQSRYVKPKKQNPDYINMHNVFKVNKNRVATQLLKL